MQEQDPLENWVFLSKADPHPTIAKSYVEQTKAGLDELEQYLASHPEKPNYRNMRYMLSPWTARINVSGKDVARAQELFRRVYQMGGSGSNFIQEGLLTIVAIAQDPASAPFWEEILEYSKPRDSLNNQRKTWALAALALQVINQDSHAAYQVLRKISQTHQSPKTRGKAVFYLDQAYQYAERPLPEGLQEEITRISTEDPAFEPRFQARASLRAQGLQVPNDNPQGVYSFKVKYQYAKGFYRTIELLSDQTLDELHFGIQRAIHWDADHLYSFYMNGVLYDRHFAFACPYEDDNPPWTDEANIGELGLVKNHKFLYHFDYGDSHEFEIEVVGIQAQAEDVTYPRVVDQKGEAPSQY